MTEVVPVRWRHLQTGPEDFGAGGFVGWRNFAKRGVDDAFAHWNTESPAIDKFFADRRRLASRKEDRREVPSHGNVAPDKSK
jgi:hypothetical protein